MRRGENDPYSARSAGCIFSQRPWEGWCVRASSGLNLSEFALPDLNDLKMTLTAYSTRYDLANPTPSSTQWAPRHGPVLCVQRRSRRRAGRWQVRLPFGDIGYPSGVQPLIKCLGANDRKSSPSCAGPRKYFYGFRKEVPLPCRRVALRPHRL